MRVTHHALFGHALLSTIVNVTLEPTVGVALFTVLVTDRSADCGGGFHTFKVAEQVFCNQFIFITVIVNVYVHACVGEAYVVHVGVLTCLGRDHNICGLAYIHVGETKFQVIIQETLANHQLTILEGFTINAHVGAGKTGVTVADAWSSSVAIWLLGVESGSVLSDAVTSIVFT